MINKTLLLVGVYLAVTFLSGCSGDLTPLPTFTAANTPTLPLPATEIAPETATQTPIPVTPTTTSTLAPTFTPTPATDLVSCLNPNNPLPLDPSQPLPGTLFFREVPEPGKPKLVALEGSSRLEGEVVADLSPYSGRVSFSPNGEWLVLDKSEFPPLELEEIGLLLISSKGKTKSMNLPAFPVVENLVHFWFSGTWFNNEFVEVTGRTEDHTLALVALFDPFTETWGPSLLDYLPTRYLNSEGAFSPDLTRAVYITGVDPNPQIALWDVEQQRVLWQATYHYGLPLILYPDLNVLAPVAWAADSSKVSFPLENLEDNPTVKIFTLTRDGEAFFIRPNVPENKPVTLSWSPDGSYLAFVSQFESNPAQSGIIIYDSQAKTAVDMCPIQAEGFGDNVETSGGFAWSPDSRYLIYGKGGRLDDESNQIVMLDLYTGKITLLKQGPHTAFVGWSAIDGWVKP